MLDKIDKKVLSELQKDADRKIYQLEKATGIPRSTVHNRIKKLKEEKIIKKIKAVVDPYKIGYNVCALIHISISFKKGVHEIIQKLAMLPNVEEAYIVTGESDIILKAWFKSNKELSEFIFNKNVDPCVWKGIERMNSAICLDIVKDNGVLE